jgi:hypothetical protein
MTNISNFTIEKAEKLNKAHGGTIKIDCPYGPSILAPVDDLNIAIDDIRAMDNKQAARVKQSVISALKRNGPLIEQGKDNGLMLMYAQDCVILHAFNQSDEVQK